jgi:hydroxymethylglutaryl-CoA synthase
MVGIVSYGAYIPYYYLMRGDLSKIWNKGQSLGERSVANFDEDSVTMSVTACNDCLTGTDPQSIDRLYFASTTAPYSEKQSASIVATTLNLRRDVFAADFSGTLRAGTDAMRAAVDAIASGSAQNVLVCASDIRIGLPLGERENSFGDGAGALLLGTGKVIANISSVYGVQNEILDVWRSDRDRFVRSWEGRFIRDAAYGETVLETASAALKKHNFTARDFSKAVFSGPNAEFVNYVARKLGFDVETQVQNQLYRSVGDTGTALPLMLLVSALEEAKPGSRILCVSYGDGCNLFILEVTEAIEDLRNRRGIRGHLLSRKPIGYEKYLQWREILPTEAPARPPADQSRPSAVALWRDRKGGLSLYGVKCKHCGTPQYPVQRVCYKCGTKDNFEEYPFNNRAAKLSSFSHDMLSPSMDPPTTICAVDFEGGGRIMCDMTDRDPERVRVGMPVEMTFRKLSYKADFYSYWWKCRPVR